MGPDGSCYLTFGKTVAMVPQSIIGEHVLFLIFTAMLVVGVSEAELPSIMRKEHYTFVGVDITAGLPWLEESHTGVVIEYPLQEVSAGHGGVCMESQCLGG